MIYLLLILFAVFIYIRGFKTTSLIIFFFFITGGFNLIPEEATKLTEGFSKASDYGLVLLAILFLIDVCFIRGFLKKSAFTIILIGLFSFTIICVLYNHYRIGVEWHEIIRTVRYLFFWLAYYIFRSMNKESLEELLKTLYIITIFTSALYLLQLVIKENILVETVTKKVTFFGIEVIRFYNQPAMLHFFVFYSIFRNPFRGVLKYLSTGILIAALFGAMFRSTVLFFVFSLFAGYFIRLPKRKKIATSAILGCILIFFSIFFLPKLSQTRTYIDVKNLLTKNIIDIVADVNMIELADATLTFRIAHLVERNAYIQENPVSMLFGAALVPEDSNLTEKMFDFKVGLIEESMSETTQLDTGDISYSILLIRYGYLGTFVNLLPFLFMFVFFYRNKQNSYGYLSFIYMIMTFGISFFSSNLIMPTTFLLPIITMLIIEKSDIAHE